MSCDISSVLFGAAGKQMWDDAVTSPLSKDCASKRPLGGLSTHWMLSSPGWTLGFPCRVKDLELTWSEPIGTES